MTEADERNLRRAVELAVEARAAGDMPFGSLLAGPDGDVLAEDRNRLRLVRQTPRNWGVFCFLGCQRRLPRTAPEDVCGPQTRNDAERLRGWARSAIQSVTVA
jgi:hypothetical protein